MRGGVCCGGGGGGSVCCGGGRAPPPCAMHLLVVPKALICKRLHGELPDRRLRENVSEDRCDGGVSTKPAVEQRRAARDSQLNLLEEIQSLIKANNYLPRSGWRLIKFCPRNDGWLIRGSRSAWCAPVPPRQPHLNEASEGIGFWPRQGVSDECLGKMMKRDSLHWEDRSQYRNCKLTQN